MFNFQESESYLLCSVEMIRAVCIMDDSLSQNTKRLKGSLLALIFSAASARHCLFLVWNSMFLENSTYCLFSVISAEHWSYISWDKQCTWAARASFWPVDQLGSIGPFERLGSSNWVGCLRLRYTIPNTLGRAAWLVCSSRLLVLNLWAYFIKDLTSKSVCLCVALLARADRSWQKLT